MQLQDRELHKQLLVMRTTIKGLKDDLSNEPQLWEVGNDLNIEETEQTPVPAYVTKVEIFRSPSAEIETSHVKQDSGILTDEDGSDKEGSAKQGPLQTHPPARGRSKSFSLSTSFAVKMNKGFEAEGRRRSIDVVRARARSASLVEGELASCIVNPPRPRSQTAPESTFTRFNSMPVINEIPGDSLHGYDAHKTKTFAVYGYRRDETVLEQGHKTSYSVTKKLPTAFSVLTRRRSLPVIYTTGGPTRCSVEFNNRRDLGLVNAHPVRRTSSQLVFSSRATKKTEDQMTPGGICRSVSQISLV